MNVTTEMSNMIDQMAAHLAVQMTVCRSGVTGQCFYQKKELRCIIGCVLPPEIIESIENGSTAVELYNDHEPFHNFFYDSLPGVSWADMTHFLERCQEYHDESYGYEQDIIAMEREKTPLHSRHNTIRRRIKKFVVRDEDIKGCL